MTSPSSVELWEGHCRCEFEKRDVNATMTAMVSPPYVNHIRTMTGGVGYEQLKRFYAHHFIPVNPPEFELTLISRTVGSDTLVDEISESQGQISLFAKIESLSQCPSRTVSFDPNRPVIR
jgi:carboxymethylenebutenolidase